MELGCWAGRKALRGFLLSTTAALSFSGGLTMQAGPASAQQGQAAGALPSVVVSAPQQRARRAQTATASRAARSNRRTTTVAPVEKKPPSVNNQDARTGQKGYVTRSVTSATKTNTALLNVPQSVTVLTKDFIRDQAFTSIGEATRYVPGVIYHQGRIASRRPRHPRPAQQRRLLHKRHPRRRPVFSRLLQHSAARGPGRGRTR